MDDQNPAVQKKINISPQLLEAVAEDSAAAQPVLRAQAFMMADEMFRTRHQMSLPQRISLMESFAKMGNLNPKAIDVGGAAGSGFSINITLPGHQKTQSVTIEAVPTEKVIEAEEAPVSEEADE
jgi:hypothetical protein